MRLRTFSNLLSFIIFLGLAGFIFYTGWTQYQLEENTCAVIHTKTSGWDETLLEPGQFSWKWERLIPENMTLHIFPLESHRVELNKTTYLPSADLYANALKIDKENFKYSIKASAVLSVSKESLMKLTTSGQITGDSFHQWTEIQKEDFIMAMESVIKKELNKNSLQDLESNTQRALSARFPWFQIQNLTILLSHYDEELYLSAKNNYLTMIETKTRKTASEDHINREIDELEKRELFIKYGELFTKYPIMVEVMKVDYNNLLKRPELKDLIPGYEE